MDATTAAIVVISLMLVLRVVTWEDITSNKAAWNTLAWFATLVALADGLSRVGFVKWFADSIAAQLAGVSPTAAIVALLLINFFGHYLFASVTAHVTAMMPVLLAVGSTIPGMNMTMLRWPVPAARHHGHHHAIRDRAEPGLLRQRLSAGGGLLATWRDLRRDLPRRVLRHRHAMDAGHPIGNDRALLGRRRTDSGQPETLRRHVTPSPPSRACRLARAARESRWTQPKKEMYD